MKNPIIAGAIAGVIMGLGGFFIASPLGAIIGLWDPFPVPPIIMLIGLLGFDVIWGVILAVIYSMFYDRIPGKGISKGIIYGFIIYLVSNVRGANLLWSFGQHEWATIFAFSGIFAPFIPYGIALGYLYKK